MFDREHSQGYSDNAMAPGAQPPQLQTPGSEHETPMYRNAVDYVGSVKKAYLNNPRVYTEFLEALEKYHNSRYVQAYRFLLSLIRRLSSYVESH